MGESTIIEPYRDPSVFIDRKITYKTFNYETMKYEKREISISDFIIENINSSLPKEWPEDLPALFFMVGLPGSGKSALARMISRKLYKSGMCWFGLHLMLKSYSEVAVGLESFPVIIFEWNKLKRNAEMAGMLFSDIVVSGLLDIEDIKSINDIKIRINTMLERFRLKIEHKSDVSPALLLLSTLLSSISSVIGGVDAVSLAKEILKITKKTDIYKRIRESFVKSKCKKKNFLLIVDDILAFSEEHSNFLDGILDKLKIKINNTNIYLLVIITITEGSLITDISEKGYTEEELIRSIVAKALKWNIDDNRLPMILARSLPIIIPPINVNEFISIIRTNPEFINVAKSLHLYKNKIEKNKIKILNEYLHCSAWHVAIALAGLRFLYNRWETEKTCLNKCSFIDYIKNFLDKCKDVYNIGNIEDINYEDIYKKIIQTRLKITSHRFYSLSFIMKKMWQSSLVLLGLSLQPSGISLKELLTFCNNIKNFVLKENSHINHINVFPYKIIDKCDRKRLELEIRTYQRKWSDLIDVDYEKWPKNDQIILIRPGSYLHHLPMLLQELEHVMLFSNTRVQFLKYIKEKLCPANTVETCPILDSIIELWHHAITYRLLLLKTIYNYIKFNSYKV